MKPFEKKVPSEKEFFTWLKAHSIEPDFTQSTMVSICGVHPYSPNQTSPMTTENYERLLKLWNAVFQRWGKEITISETCTHNNEWRIRK